MPRKKIDLSDKKKHLQFVYLTEEEHRDLCEIYGPDGAADWIEQLNDYIGSKGDKYESHYYTIRMWARRKAVRSSECGVRSNGNSNAERAMEVVIGALKNPAYRSMPEFTPQAHQATYTALARMGLSWPELKRRIGVEGPELIQEFKAQFLRAYAANAECGMRSAE